MIETERAAIEKAVQAVPYWRHRIPLPLGIVTPGRIGGELVKRLALPQSLAGKTLLDIGTFDGLVAFEAEKRHADDVLAIDVWDGNGTDDPEHWREIHTGGMGFRTAHSILRSGVRWQNIDVYSVSEQSVGRFNYVIMCGVLYHLRDPVLALTRALSVTRETLLVESLFTSSNGEGRPVAVFAKHLNTGVYPSNWWEFSVTCLEHMCYAAGARSVSIASMQEFPKTRRSIRLEKGRAIFDRPKTCARTISTLDDATVADCVGRCWTLRDGSYWWHIYLPTPTAAAVAGWVRYRTVEELPDVSEHAKESEEQNGRVVLSVCS